MFDLTKTVTTFVDRITEDGQLHVKRVTRVFEDGVQIGADAIHRSVVAPGDAEYADAKAILDAHLEQAEVKALARAAASEVT